MSFFFAVPILVLFRQDHGLNMTQIMLLQSVYNISVVILEVPSWYFADLFGRKKSLVLASLFWFFGMLCYGFGHSFGMFLVAEILFAVWMSAMSGADSAFLYDTLKDLGREKDYKKIWWNSLFLFLWISALAQLIGGFVAKYGIPLEFLQWVDPLRLTIFLWLPLSFVAVPIAMSFYEPKHHKRVLEKWYIQDLLITLKKEIWWNKNLLLMMIFFSFLMTSYQTALRLYQPYFQHIGLDLIWFGVIFAGFQLFSGIIWKFAWNIEKKLGLSLSLLLNMVLVILSYILMWSIIGTFSFLFCFIQQFVRGFYGVTVSDYVNQQVSSKYRATIQSIQSLWWSLVYAILVPFFGFFVDIYSIQQALIVVGITVAVLLVPVFLLLVRKWVLNKFNFKKV